MKKKSHSTIYLVFLITALSAIARKIEIKTLRDHVYPSEGRSRAQVLATLERVATGPVSDENASRRTLRFIETTGEESDRFMRRRDKDDFFLGKRDTKRETITGPFRMTCRCKRSNGTRRDAGDRETLSRRCRQTFTFPRGHFDRKEELIFCRI